MSTKLMRAGRTLTDLPMVASFSQPRVGHRHIAHIGLDGAEREVGGRGGGGARQRIEEGRLADIRQADDAHLETHGEAPEIVGLHMVRMG